MQNQSFFSDPIVSGLLEDLPLLTESFDIEGSHLSSLSDINDSLIDELPLGSDSIPSLRKKIMDDLSGLTQSEDKEKQSLEVEESIFLLRTIGEIEESLAGSTFDFSKSEISIEQGYRSLMKGLIGHELGHFMGLGHNFKQNILPKESETPPSVYSHLKERAENGFQNFHTLMGYPSASIEMQWKYEEIEPGAYDIQVLQYIYNKK